MTETKIFSSSTCFPPYRFMKRLIWVSVLERDCHGKPQSMGGVLVGCEKFTKL